MPSVADLTLDLQEIQSRNRPPLLVADLVVKAGERALQRRDSLPVVIDACLACWDRHYVGVTNRHLRDGIDRIGSAIPHFLRGAQEVGS